MIQPITVELALYVAGREVRHSWRPELEGEQYLKTIAVLDPGGSPILRVPFYIHEDVRTLHTVCSRLDEGMRQVEW